MMVGILIIPILLSSMPSAKNISIIYADPNIDLQDLIDKIEPSSIIILQPGEYKQSFRITKPITITSEDQMNTIINVTTDQNKPAITINSEQVHLSNLCIRNNAPGLYTTGIRVLKDNVTIDQCIFQQTPIGISIWSNENTINNCSFIFCSDEGIVLLSTAYSTANHNVIKNCYFENNCDAIELQQSCYNTIKDCIMINNTHTGIDAIAKENNHNIISNCTIKNNRVHGIYFTHSKENKIINCVIEQNHDGNIITPNSENTTIITPIVESISTINIASSMQSPNNTMKSDFNITKNTTIFTRILDFITTIVNLLS